MIKSLQRQGKKGKAVFVPKVRRKKIGNGSENHCCVPYGMEHVKVNEESGMSSDGKMVAKLQGII
jgi:hypothetical protein